MAYVDRFLATNNLIVHLKTVIGTIADPAIIANYAGFLSVSCVTVYELAIKDIFSEFASKKNKVFGTFIEKHFAKINGRIKIDDLRGTHVKLFGDKYLERFCKKLQKRESEIFTASRVSIITVYGNLVVCRHQYVHAGAPTLTISEVMDSYENGKEVIHCLSDSMKR